MATPQPSIPALPIPSLLAEVQPRREFADIISTHLTRMTIIARRLNFKRTLSQLEHLAEYLRSAATTINRFQDEQLPHDLRFLRQAFNDDLAEISIFVPDAGRSAWYQHEKPFGEEVFNAFPRMRRDLTEAGNCYATDNNTGCVFHLMRVIGQAIRALAKRLNVKGLKADLDYEDFRHIQDKLKEKLAALRNSKRGKKREQEINFYADVAVRCQYFKEMWRDNVMHSRQNYDDPAVAGRILTRVQEFMKRLAERLNSPA